MSRDNCVCCDKCVEIIGRKSTGAARLWLDLCAIGNELDFKESSILVAKVNDFPELRLLEMLRFVTSTETDRFLLIKLHGLHRDDEECSYFCIHEAAHG